MERLQTAHALCSQRRRGGIRSVSAGRARMRKKNSIINMIVGLVGQLLNMLLSFGGRMVFVHYLSQEYLGVNGLFGDVLGMLNLAELGIGSAMIFSMYRPAAQNDEKQLARLMNLYRTLYRIVALAVLGIGLALMPFLPRLMKGGEGIENLQLIYLLYLLQAVTSYLLSYKNAIYQAYQKAYIRKALDQIIGIVRLILQIVVLVTTRNFILYLIIQLFMPMLTSAIIWARADREFPYLKQYKELPEPQERKAIFKNVGALSLHKLATVIVRSTDNLIMSAFDGLATVGIYSNYKLVLMNVNNLLGHVTGAFTASIGNLNALEGRKRVYEIFRILDFAAFLLYGYLSGGLVTLINFFIRMIFGEEYLFSMTVVVIIMAEFFISGLRQMGLQFREALGLFWYDRYKALAEAIINLVVSLILVRRFGVAGIIGGTIISSLLTCVWFEPYVLMRYGIEEDWQKKLRRYFMDYIVRWVVVAGVSAVSYWIFQLMPQTNFFWFIAQGLIYTAIFAAVVLTVYGRTPEFQYLLEMTVRKLRKKLRGGAETYMLRIGEELTRRGHQVEYFGMYDEKNTVGNAEGLTTANMDFHASGAEKLLYPFRIIYSGEARRKMRQVIDRFHPDIIHFNNINFQLTPSVILAGAERNIPMVQTVHDLQMLCPNHMMMEFGTWKLCEECSGKKCKMACVRKKCIHGSRAKSLIGAIEGTIYTSSHVYDRVARYICPSRFIEEKLLTVPRYAGKTTMIHNFLSKTAEIDVPKGDYVLYFGRLSEEKGIDRILAACRLLPEIPFVIAGGGPLEELCRTCELPNVRFVGFKTGRELQELVAAARFTLHLSLWYENCPLALLESQSLGTPVLCNRIGGMPELVEEGKTGVLNDTFTPEAYAEKIRALYSDSALLDEMARNCRAKKESMMTLDRYCDRLLEIYMEEIGGKRA